VCNQNWSPKIVLSDGLDATIAYFRERLRTEERDCPHKRLLARLAKAKAASQLE